MYLFLKKEYTATCHLPKSSSPSCSYIFQRLRFFSELKITRQQQHRKLSSEIFIKNCHQKLSAKIVSKNCHQNCHQNCNKKLSSKIVIKNCHEKMSLKIVIKNCHQKLSSNIFIENCHKKLSLEIVIKNCHKCLKGHKSLGSLCSVVKSVLVVPIKGPSKGQVHLLSCSGQLKKTTTISESISFRYGTVFLQNPGIPVFFSTV